MIRKTEAIVLYTRKFRESSLLTTLYTKEFGRKQFIVQGYRSTRAKKRHSYFQPMSIIDIVFYDKSGRDFQKITETGVKNLFLELQTDPVKITLGLLTIEVFQQAVREEEQNLPLYDFLKTHLLSLDKSKERHLSLLFYFLIQLSKFLGCFPIDHSNGARDIQLDVHNGQFIPATKPNPSASLFRDFTLIDRVNCKSLAFSAVQKQHLMQLLLLYYQTHLPGFQHPKSLQVFEEVFRGKS